MTEQTKITAVVKDGQKSLSLDVPESWHSSRSLAIDADGSEFAFLGNDGEVYRGKVSEVSAQALAFGYCFGAKQKADSDGAKDKNRTASTAERITGVVVLDDWLSKAERQVSVDPLAAQVRALLLGRLNQAKPKAAIKKAGIKLTGFSGGSDAMIKRYFEVVKEAMGQTPSDDQAKKFSEMIKKEAQAALDNIDDSGMFE